MDPATYTFLFKRWEDDYANSRRLEQELEALRQQNNRLLGELQTLRLEKQKPIHALPSNSPQASQTLRQADIEVELGKCTEDGKLKEQLHCSAAQIQNLKTENDTLRLALQRYEGRATCNAQSLSDLHEHLQQLTLENTSLIDERNQLALQNEELKLKYKDLQTSAKHMYDANATLQEEAEKAARQFESLQPEMVKVAATAAKYEEYEAKQKHVVASYEKQTHDLRLLLEAKEKENKEVRDELATLRCALQKAQDLRKSFVSNLQGTILPKLNLTSNNSQLNSGHKRQPSTSTTSTLKPHTEIDEPNNGGQKHTSDQNMDDGKSKGQENSHAAIAKSTRKLSDITPMPAERLQAFAASSAVCPNVADIGEKGLFEREFLKHTIGGAVQALIVRVTNSQTALAKAREITTYLCPGLDHNPWCPRVPGENGYMFVGLGREKDTFLEPQNFNVFVGQLKSKSSQRRKYRYIGVYSAVRVAPLTADEWNPLSEFVKETYVSRTKEKTNDSRTLAQIRAAYDLGELTVPCVKLEFVTFDEVLYTSLLSENSKPLEGQPLSAKKRRVSNADSTQGSQRKRVTLAV